MFFNLATQNPFFFYSWILIITFSICVHEYAHAQVALWKGDDTAAVNGHLSLNPLVQMGLSSLIMLVLVGIAWGAVPVDVSKMRGKSASAQVAFAGPAANLILCALFGILGAVADTINLSRDVQAFIALAAMANGVLFLFNMIPFPMFDGWTVLSLFVEPMQRIDVRRIAGYSWMALIVIWTTGIMDRIWDIGALMGGTVKAITSAIINVVVPGL
jgi:Zn-dependent protease